MEVFRAGRGRVCGSFDSQRIAEERNFILTDRMSSFETRRLILTLSLLLFSCYVHIHFNSTLFDIVCTWPMIPVPSVPFPLLRSPSLFNLFILLLLWMDEWSGDGCFEHVASSLSHDKISTAPQIIQASFNSPTVIILFTSLSNSSVKL